MRETSAKAFLLFFLSAGCALPLLGDQIFFLPTGYTLQPQEVRFLWLSPTKAQREKVALIGVGVVHNWEVNGLWEEKKSGDKTVSLNIQHSIVQPYPDLFPGISVGVLDLFNETEEGRSFYVAGTWQTLIYTDWATTERGSFTVGVGTKRFRGAFVAPAIKGHVQGN
ncbi:MAG: hypothetical protein K6T17_04075, partial [Fimbriimonadales bacterium]|nr:hypothetical protein [Fimbriimonadales bacterium]